jgi:hypothetical protein
MPSATRQASVPREAARPFDARCLASSKPPPARASRSRGVHPFDSILPYPPRCGADGRAIESCGAGGGARALAERPRWRRRARADEHGQNGHGDPFSSGQKRMMRHDPNVDYDLLDTVRSVGLRSVKPSSVFIENPYLYHPLIVDALCAAKRARPSVSWPRGRRGLRADRVDRGQGIRLAQPTRRPGCRPESLASRLRPRCVRRESSGAADSGSPSLDAAPGVASSA